MTQLLSFDVGIKNMGYCYATIDDGKLNILNLNKVDLNCKKNNIQLVIIKYDEYQQLLHINYHILRQHF